MWKLSNVIKCAGFDSRRLSAFLESKSFGTGVGFRKKNYVKKEKSTKNNIVITKIPVFEY